MLNCSYWQYRLGQGRDLPDDAVQAVPEEEPQKAADVGDGGVQVVEDVLAADLVAAGDELQLHAELLAFLFSRLEMNKLN